MNSNQPPVYHGAVGQNYVFGQRIIRVSVSKYAPHQNIQERERRRKQIERGQLRLENGYTPARSA